MNQCSDVRIAGFPHLGFRSFFSGYELHSNTGDRGSISFVVDGSRLRVVPTNGGEAELSAKVARLPTDQRQQSALVADVLNAMASRCNESTCRVALPMDSRELRLLLRLPAEADAKAVSDSVEKFMIALEDWRTFVSTRSQRGS